MKTVDLNEKWFFTEKSDLANIFEKMDQWKPVTLPHCWNAVDGQTGSEEYFRGKCWYQRKICINDEDLDKQIYLEIGAAGLVSEVYVNGQFIMKNKCGFSMYRALLNPFLKATDNMISIMVDNSYHEDVYPLMADFTFYGGLYREVKLVIADTCHFDLMDHGRDGVYLTQKCIRENTYELRITGSVINELAASQEGMLKFTLLDKDQRTVYTKCMDVKVAGKLEFDLLEVIDEVIPWQGVENPYLYQFTAELICEGRVFDTRTIEIGFRDIKIAEDNRIFLNGKSMKLNGVSRHQDFAGVGNAISKEHMDLDMQIMKEMGVNSIRLAHYQHDDYFYSLCDREGMLVWAEIPFISLPTTTDKTNQNAKEQLELLIKQAYNHSSIFCWGVQNEITIAVENERIHELVKEIIPIARELDSSRLIAQANVYTVADDSALNKMTDIVGYNLYYGWYYGEMVDLGPRLDAFHKENPNIPVLVSEYGVDTNPKFHSYCPTVRDYTEEYQLLFNMNAIKTIQERPFVLGGYHWNMFDFGSAMRKEGGESGKNLKGLVSLDRTIKKDAYFLYKACWSKSPFVHLAGKRFENRHEVSNEIVVLSNLKHIKLFLNQEPIGEMNHEEPMKVFKNVKLSAGSTLIEVEGYDDCGTIYKDQMNLKLVSEPDTSYLLVKEEEEEKEDTRVANWFEKFDLTKVQEIILKEGCFSIFDSVQEIYNNEEAKLVFEKYFPGMVDHPRFRPMMGMMTIDSMSKIVQLKIPMELLPVINMELSNVSKK